MEFENKDMDQKYAEVSLQEWIITIFIAALPIVNIVMLFVWSFSENTKASKANWARATLIWIAVVFVIYLLFAYFFFTSVYDY